MQFIGTVQVQSMITLPLNCTPGKPAKQDLVDRPRHLSSFITTSKQNPSDVATNRTEAVQATATIVQGTAAVSEASHKDPA